MIPANGMSSSHWCAQDVLMRMLDSVIGGFRPDFLEKIGECGDL